MDQHIPWFKRSKDEAPYSWFRSISSKEGSTQPFNCVAAFPWRKNSLDEVLYKGSTAANATLQAEWEKMVEKWTGAILVGSTACFHVFRKLGRGKSLCVTISRPSEWTRSWNIRSVAWAITRHEPSHPVAIAAVSSVLFIVDLHPEEPRIIGRIRGHGDDIMSIAVHPYYPYLFLTTSKDGTTRMYDLTYTPRQVPNNPHWPPAQPTQPSFAGPAFGLHMSESEGDGIGRCVAVLVGGLSGGHEGAVFHAAWHPSADLIATCGMDRCVKIWRVPPVDHAKVEVNEEHLAREDKPLFSTSQIHKARVLSITWLSNDILVSHSAPALMRGSSVDDMYDIPGTITVWMWLGFSRFLPDGRVRKIMRGGLSDFRESDSFKVLAEYSLPMSCRVLSFAPIIPRRQNPQVFVDDGNRLRIFSLSEFKPKTPPPFPLDGPDEPVDVVQGSSMHVDETEPELVEGVGGMSVDDNEEDEDEPPMGYKREPLPIDLIENVPHWIVPKDVGGTAPPTDPSVDRWQSAFDGRMLLAVSEKGTVSMWKLNAP